MDPDLEEHPGKVGILAVSVESPSRKDQPLRPEHLAHEPLKPNFAPSNFGPKEPASQFGRNKRPAMPFQAAGTKCQRHPLDWTSMC